jgi:methionine-rich copper-binding protein CopC
VDKGKSISGNVMRIGVGAMPAGGYTVTWHVLSVDTHTTQGSFNFRVGR